MKKFKIIDVWVSIILILTGTITSLIKMDKSVIYVYFIIGGWQSVSMMIHIGLRWFTNSRPRALYHTAVLFLLVLMLCACIFPALMIPALVLLLLTSPFLAIYYSYVCYQEAFVSLQRPLAQLR